MMAFALEEMQRATGASRALWRLMDEGRVYEHVRPGTRPVDPLPSQATQIVRESPQLLVVRERSEIAAVPGLAISRGLVEAHGGHLRYRPPHDGRPHAFVVELPAV
jgi:hypothetical protein